jgi:hypothetical protein
MRERALGLRYTTRCRCVQLRAQTPRAHRRGWPSESGLWHISLPLSTNIDTFSSDYFFLENLIWLLNPASTMSVSVGLFLA